MSSLWYEYLEETGGEIIPLNYFKHVCRSLEKFNDTTSTINFQSDKARFAYNYEKELWWPVMIIEQLSEGWIKLEFFGIDSEDSCLWCDLRKDTKLVKSIRWCVDYNVMFKCPKVDYDINIEAILEQNRDVDDIKLEYVNKSQYAYQTIKIGAYLECWLESSIGFVWPVKVLSNIGGRLKLIWFGCDCNSKPGSAVANNTFSMFYLDYRLHSLGWARISGWKYSPPSNVGINISISNVDTFVRGSPCAFPMELGCDRVFRDHCLEEGWQLEAVNPVDPSQVHAATVRYVLDRRFMLVELDQDEGESVMFAAFGGMAELLPANTSSISGYALTGLRGARWEQRLAAPPRYAPHLGYFHNGGGIDSASDGVFLPGCKLEAVNPWDRRQVHAATVIRAMDGSRLVWIRLDSEPDLPDFLVDPATSTDLYPVGWCEMVGHNLILPSQYMPGRCDLLGTLSLVAPFDSDDITIYLRPQCFVGPFISRSVAIEMLPQFIGPGHCLPVMRELFQLLLKVSHKPYKLMRLLQFDDDTDDGDDDRHELMASIAVPCPKRNEWGNRGSNRRSHWLVEVAIRKRAIAGFCRQTALSLGACPLFIGTVAPTNHQCRLACEARMAARAGDKMSQQRRKQLFARPLTDVGLSYRELKKQAGGGAVATSNSSSNSDDQAESSDHEDTITVVATESRMCTRGMRLVVGGGSRRLPSKRRSMAANNGSKMCFSSAKEAKLDEEVCEKYDVSPSKSSARHESRGRHSVPQSLIDVRDYVIDPVFLAGDIERVTLTSNPLEWTVEQLAEYLTGTDCCRQLIAWLTDERVDGRAFLLLTLPVLSTLYGLQLEVAIGLCKHVVSLKRVFVEQYADLQQLLPDDI